ncbi:MULTISPECIES: LutC/YkgG family protein [unclassified Carboxylicivirga]|uniref:LutC/YkgG family protein n=1 Tax=Carboxylicivirga TaxID=1628153 RepID=UPI003D326C71
MNKQLKDDSDKARASILARLKKSCDNTSGRVPRRCSSAAFFPQPDPLLDTFVDEFRKIKGQVFLCEDEDELKNQLQALQDKKQWKHIACCDKALQELLPVAMQQRLASSIDNAEVGITTCECLIARTGSIMVSAGQDSGRMLPVFPPVHLVIAHQQQIVPFLDEAIQNFKVRHGGSLPSQACVITGPSRTADIEKTLVMGAHGPKELILFIRL